MLLLSARVFHHSLSRLRNLKAYAIGILGT